jgi:hypothetical protein
MWVEDETLRLYRDTLVAGRDPVLPIRRDIRIDTAIAVSDIDAR